MSNIPPYKELDPRVQKTIDLLYQALIELLQEKHYKYIKVQDITKTAKINRATFYNHFENITDFILFCTREGFRREVALKFPVNNFDYNKDNFNLLVHRVLEFMSNEFYKWNYRWDEILFVKGLQIEFYHYLSEWIDYPDKYIDQPLFGDTYALLVSSSVIGLGMVWCDNGCIEPVNELSNRITETFSLGLPGIN